MKFKNIIIGYGASGLFLAKHLSSSDTLVIEKNSLPGVKLKITGNGYSNFANLKEKNNFLSYISNNKFFFSAISTYTPKDIVDFFKGQGLAINYRENDRIFTQNGSSELIDILKNNKCSVLYNTVVTDIKNNKVITTNGVYTARNIIIATGGMSYKNTGCDGFIYDFAKKNNLKTIPSYSVEGRLIYKQTSTLSGTSFSNVTITYGKKQESGTFLFTHTGFSGSACLKICEHLKQNSTLYINFLPNCSEKDFLHQLNTYKKEGELKTFLTSFFTKSFSEYLINILNLKTNIKIKHLNDKINKELLKVVFNKEYCNVNPIDIDKATITGGGLSLKEINPKTFNLKNLNNIYVIGESLDIHGQIGGYNLSLAFIEAYNVYNEIKNQTNV